MTQVTPNDVAEPTKEGGVEGATDTPVTPSAQETEAEKEQREKEEAISVDDFKTQLENPSSAPKDPDFAAKADHESKMLQASVRINAYAKTNEVDKDQAALDLLDEGKITQNQANYLFKNSFGTKPAEQSQATSKDQIKAELRAEDKLYSAVAAGKLNRQQAKVLINDYRTLAANNTPENAAEFALYRAGITAKQATDEAYRQGVNHLKVAKPNGGVSPTTPKKSSSKISEMDIEEYEKQSYQEIQELQDLQGKGLA